jgi:O-methyltransferase
MTPVDLYLDLLKRTLTRSITEDGYVAFMPGPGTHAEAHFHALVAAIGAHDLSLVRTRPFDLAARSEGRDWPATAETMIGLKRLDNLEYCVRTVLDEGIEGDLVETGVWRGGAAILMRAVLRAYGDTQRSVWLADSFAGLPKPDAERYPQDAGDLHWSWQELAISREAVEANFRRYGLLDDQVRFIEGWFRDTLPTAPIERIAVLRLDGDMYESTIVALESLYAMVAPGGFVIVDDYGAVPGCRQAVDDFRGARDISEAVLPIDWAGAYWRVQS